MPDPQQLADSLIDWYWSFGRARGEGTEEAADQNTDLTRYDLPPADWLTPLYEARKAATESTRASGPRRRALALWGLSQTGKSTALAFVDGGHVPDGNEDTDGVGTGVHWPGGQPFVYQPPHRKGTEGYPRHWWFRCYNPFNTANDASGCLTRLTPGSLEKAPGRIWVSDPAHPVRLELIAAEDLLLTVARGYDSQVLGPGKAGKPAPWSLEAIERTVAKTIAPFGRRVAQADRVEPDRLAFERLWLLCRVLEELRDQQVETYANIAKDQAAWRQWLETNLLNDMILLASAEAVEALTAALLWGGSTFTTARYNELRTLLEKVERDFGGREIMASMEAAMLLVDMNSGVDGFDNHSRETKQGARTGRARTMGANIESDGVKIGCGGNYRRPLGGSAENYAGWQALVWEIVLPVNLDNLPPTAARELLEQTDLLDFPGVGREPVNETTRIEFHADGMRQGNGEELLPKHFFERVLKRGRTTSIVANYARRMNIDAFAILQSLDGSTPPSEDMVGQVLDGCKAWRRHGGFDETEYREARGSRLPLAFVLTFWGKKMRDFAAGNATNFRDGVSKWYRNFGFVASGETSVAFALNYHWFGIPETELGDFKVGSPLYEGIVNEPDFQRLFASPESRASFDQMISDRESGGLSHFLITVTSWFKDRDDGWRERRFERLREDTANKLERALSWRHLIPERQLDDNRPNVLRAFRRRLLDGAADADATGLRDVLHALLYLFDVDANAVAPGARGGEPFGAADVERWFGQWKSDKLSEFDAAQTADEPGDIDWARLQFATREQLSELMESWVSVLGTEICGSIADRINRQAALIPAEGEGARERLKRLIATELTNRLIYFDPAYPDHPVRTLPVDPHADYEGLPAAVRRSARRDILLQVLFGQIEALVLHAAPRLERPALPGDQELLSLLPS